MRATWCFVLAGCFAPPDYANTQFKCDVEPVCPEGFECISGVCREELPSGMVMFAAGAFTMGCKSVADCLGDAPEHLVPMSAFAIDKHEVTEAQFEQCIIAGQCAATTVPIVGNGSNLPVRGVTWTNARSYCQSVGKDLPTEAQWERAARTGTVPFPWSGGFDCTKANALACDLGGVVDVEALPDGATSEGLTHVGGNVREWVLDSYSDEFYISTSGLVTDPINDASSNVKVTRGGSFKTDVAFLKVWYRDSEDVSQGGATAAGEDLGVRCAKRL